MDVRTRVDALVMPLVPVLVWLVIATPRFETAAIDSENGAALLRWSASSTGPFEVQLGSDPEFTSSRTAYLGHDDSTFVSGLLDGEHHYRVRVAATDTRGPDSWSEPAVVTVRHHSPSMVWPLFAIGAFTFVATAGFVVVAARKEGARTNP